MNTLKNEMICGSYKGNPNYCKPYITRDMFEKLQNIIKRNPRTSTNEHSYYFKGLIKCPECGCRMNGTPHVTKRGEKTYVYYHYRCYNHRINGLCSFSTTVFENSLEKQLLEKLEQIVADKKLKSIELKSKGDKVSKYNVAELQAELDRLNYSWQKGRIKNVEEYDRKYDSLIEQIEAANAEHLEMNDEPNYEKIQSVLSGGWKEIYSNLDSDHKQTFWRSIIEEITLDWSGRTKHIVDIIFL